MSESLAQAIAFYGIVLAGVSGLRAATGRSIAEAQKGAAIVLELASALQATLAVLGLAGGHAVSERGVLLAYLAASVGLLPFLWPLAASDASGWGGATLAIASLAVGVVALRGISLWQG